MAGRRPARRACAAASSGGVFGAGKRGSWRSILLLSSAAVLASEGRLARPELPDPAPGPAPALAWLADRLACLDGGLPDMCSVRGERIDHRTHRRLPRSYIHPPPQPGARPARPPPRHPPPPPALRPPPPSPPT